MTDQESESDEDVSPSRRRFLWAQADSYGYTSGSLNVFVFNKKHMTANKVNRPFTLRNGEFSFGKRAPYGQKNKNTRLPEAVPQPIGLFLFCIEFGWG